MSASPDNDDAGVPAIGRSARDPRLLRGLPVMGLLAITMIVFRDVLFDATGRLAAGHDIWYYFAPARAFAAWELHHGNLPLWNPWLMSGTPFLGAFQSALLYPLNWTYLFAPVARALNFEMILHFFLLGLFTHWWLLGRGLRPLAAFFGGAMVMLSAGSYLHLYAGHLTLQNTVAWVPLILLAVDRIFQRPKLLWVLLGAVAVSMQILAGFPQTVYLTALVVGLYSAIRLPRSEDPKRIVAALAAMAVLPLFLSAAQLWVGIETVLETSRTASASFAYSSSFSFPPENLITLIVPDFFGDPIRTGYWGKWFYWEACAFIGVSALVLAVYGGLRGAREHTRHAVPLILVFLVLALGSNTPVFRFAYDHVPLLDNFRAPGRFIFFATFFASALAGAGIDRLQRDAKDAKALALGVLVLGALTLAASAFFVRMSEHRGSENFIERYAFEHHEGGRAFWQWNVDVISIAPAGAAFGLGIAAFTCFALAGSFWATRSKPRAIWLVCAVGIVELVVFASTHRGASYLGERDFAAPEDPNRMVDAGAFAQGTQMTELNVWGYEPLMLSRYGEFIAMTQGKEEIGRRTSRGVDQVAFHPLFAMLRCDTAVGADGVRRSSGGAVLPECFLVNEYEVLPTGEELLKALADPGFDTRKTVLLESEPSPAPERAEMQGTVEVVDRSTDHLTIHVELSSPAILVVTDAYSRGWRAVALEGSDQTEYEVMPANHILRAVPLSAGTHRLRMEYVPRSFALGLWVSIVSWFGVLGLLLAMAARARRDRPKISSAPLEVEVHDTETISSDAQTVSDEPQETETDRDHEPEQSTSVRNHAIAATGIVALVLGVYGGVLFASGEQVLSLYPMSDIFLYFIYIREFAFDQLAQGNLALWNPHIFAGTPLLGDIQSAVLYPPNWIHLFLPTATAINLEVLFHIALLALFSYAWFVSKVRRPLAAFFGAVVMMCAGVVSLRVLAGQLTVIAAVAWTPLLFIAIDQVLEGCEKGRSALGWCLAGVLATSMMMLAGYPHSVFMAGLAAGVYSIVRLWGASDRLRAAVWLAAIAGLPIGITAIQWMTGMQVSGESLRAEGLPYEFATTYSFSPENLLTAFVPGFFGDLVHRPYWGRWFVWDATAYMGVVALVLAGYGAIGGRGPHKRTAIALTLGFLVLSLGKYTPVYEIVYTVLPGFDLFRAPSKYIFIAMFFATYLAVLGADRVLETKSSGKRAAVGSAAIGLALAGLALLIRRSILIDPENGAWQRIFDWVMSTGEISPLFFPYENMYRNTAVWAVQWTQVSAALCFALAALLWIKSQTRWAAHAIIVLGILELLVFARFTQVHYPARPETPPDIASVYDADRGDSRVLDTLAPNLPVREGAMGLWGYNPVMLGRYAELIAATQRRELSPIEMTLYAPQVWHPIYSMLRVSYVIREDDGERLIEHHPEPMPRFLFLHDYRVLYDQREALDAVMSEDFDFRSTVILEEEPSPAPEPASDDENEAPSLRLVDGSTDHVSLDIHLDRPAILLMTDSYSKGWEVRSRDPEHTGSYRLIPANYALRAIPLSRGHHQLRIEYRPSAFRIGSIVSGVSVTLYAFLFAFWAAGRYRETRQPEQ